MKLKICLTLKLKWLLYSNFELSTFFYPSKPKDLTNPLAKSDPQTLRAGFELHSIQILCSGPGRGPAEYCQQAARKQAEK